MKPNLTSQLGRTCDDDADRSTGNVLTDEQAMVLALARQAVASGNPIARHQVMRLYNSVRGNAYYAEQLRMIAESD